MITAFWIGFAVGAVFNGLAIFFWALFYGSDDNYYE